MNAQERSNLLAAHINQVQWLDMQWLKSQSTTDQATCYAIKKRLREGIMQTLQWSRYFSVFPVSLRNVMHPEDCETFLFDHNTRCIRKFNGRYYILNVKSYTAHVLTTECPDDYPLHMFPADIPSSMYPEELMGRIIAEKEPE